MGLLGIALPMISGPNYASRAWIAEEAIWFARHGSDEVVHGQTAKSLAVSYLGVGLFCHFRWLWGLVPIPWVFEVGTVVSLICFIGGLVLGAYYLFS